MDQSQEHLRNAIVPVAPRIMNLSSHIVSKMQHWEEFMKEVTSAKVAQTPMITGDSNVSRRPTNVRHTLTSSQDNPQNPNMHGTPIRWAYYCIFRAANAPDLGGADLRS